MLEDELTEEKKMSSLSLAVIYCIAFGCIIVTPIIAEQLAPMFDYIDYGALRHLFMEIITCVLWALEIVIIAIICKKHWNVSVLMNPKTHGKELPAKNMIILAILSIVSILIISAQIGFEVKPFHDMGVKITGYELIGNIGMLFRNAIKCGFMVLMIRCAQKFTEQIIGKGRSRFIWGGLILFLTVGIYELLIGANTLPLTYLLLNLLFGWIYLLTDRSISKTYLFVLLIYFF